MSNKLSFSLNPEANPSYIVNGFEFGFGPEDSLQSASTGNTVSVTISAGLDGTNIAPERVRVWMKTFSARPEDPEPIKADLNLLEKEVESLERGETEFMDAIHQTEEKSTTNVIINDASWKLIYDYSLNNSKGNSVVTKTFSVTLPEGIEMSKYYVLGITGCDIDDVEFAQKTVYGFEGNTVGVPPIVTFDSPQNLSVWPDFEKPEFKGTAVIPSKSLYLTELSAEIRITDESTNTLIGEYTDKTTCRIEDEKNVWTNSELGALTWDSGEEKWYLDATKFPGLIEKFNHEKTKGLHWLATVKVSGKSSSAHEGEYIESIHIDTVSPKVVLSSITPRVIGSDYFGAGDQDIYLNGKISITGNVEDLNLSDDDDAVSYDILASVDGSEPVSILSELIAKKEELGLDAMALDGKFDGKLGKVFSINIPIDTNMITKYFGETDRKIQTEFVVTAKDKAGNVGTYSSKLLNSTTENPDGKNFVIYQETNRPKITLGNADTTITKEDGIEEGKNLFGITNNNRLQIAVSDDDSIVDYEIFVWKLGTEEPKIPSRNETPGKTSASINYVLPEEPGTYNVKIVARDFIRSETNGDENNPTGINVTGPFVIGVDPGAPILRLSSPSDDSWISAGTDIDISGTVSKQEGVTVSGYIYSKDGENQVKVADVTGISIEEVENEDKTKTYYVKGKFRLPAEIQGKYVLHIEAKDIYKLSSHVDIGIGVDKTAPVWVENYEKSPFRVNKKAYSYTEGESNHTWYNAESLLFSGAWKETQDESGIESVYWKVIKPGETDSAPSALTDFPNSFVTKREKGIDYETFSQNLGEFIVKNDADGNAQANIVYLMAADFAGNHSEVKKFYIYIDAESPSFESHRTGTQYSNKKLPIEVTGTATDDAAGVESVALTISLDNNTVPLEISEGVTEIQASLTDANDEPDVNKKNWKAEIPQAFLAKLQEKPYAVRATIRDKAGNKSASTIFRIDVDDKDPEVKNISLSDESDEYNVYRTTENEAEVFYAHNGDKFALTGSVQDAKAGIESIKIYADLNPTDENPVPIKTETSLPIYNIDLSSSKYPRESVKLTLVAKDHAGNETTQELAVKFDNLSPKGIHAIDKNRKDLFFRIGEIANDDITPSDSRWVDALDKDVGGKYSEGTYGNASTVKIRGAFRENGSGLSMIYYRLISGERENDEIRVEADSFFADYKTRADGYFAPLAKEKYEEKRVFFSPNANGKLTNEDDDEVSFDSDNPDYTDFAKDFGSLADGEKSYATVITNYYNVISGFSVGKNYLFLVAVDNVGNAVIDGIKLKDSSQESGYLMHPDISINVDNQVPTGGRTKSEGESDIIYTNKTAGSKITITGIAEDQNAGLRSIVIKNGEKEISMKDGEYGKIEITSPVNSKSGDKNWSWKAEIKADKFFADSPDGSTSLSAIITDDAGVGNSQTVNLATVIIDTGAPEVSLDTPKDAEPATADIIEINGTISLSGSVKDENSLPEDEIDGTGNPVKSNTIKRIRYAKFDTLPDSAPANDSTLWQELTGLSIKGSYTFTAAGFNTTSYDDEKFYYIQAVGEDQSGNIGYSPAQLVKISQDTDRPKVKINNLNPNGSSYILKYGSKAQVTGTITDDDSTNSSTIKKLFITEDEYTGSGAEPANLANSTGDFTFQPSDIEDGVKTFYIYIEDNEGGKFYTTATAATGTPNIGIPKIYVKGEAVSETVNKTKFTYSSDGTNPVVKLGEGLPYASKDSAVAKDGNGNDFALTTSEKPTSNATLNASFKAGGLERKFVKLYFTANDASGIAGMTVELKNEDEHVVAKLATASKIGDLEMNGYQICRTFESSSSGASDATWITDFIDLSDAGTGQLSVSVTPYDNAALSGNGAFQINVDNTAPSIVIRSPNSGDEVSGSVSISGTASDTGVAGTTNIQWIVPTVDEANTYKAKTSEAEKLTYLKSLSLKGGISALANAASVTAWQFDFDGTKNDKFDVYDSATYAGANITSDGVYTLPVYFLATDDLGNCSAKTDFVIKHNPDADKPKLEFTYPTKKDYNTAKNENFAVLGGTIRATGSAEIPSRTTTVNSIYFQIADENALFTGTAAASEEGTDSYKAKNTYGYTVVSAYDVIREITGNQSITTISEDHLKTYGFKSIEDVQAWWGIKASGTGAWNIKLNERGELNPILGTNNITIRACGVNAEGKFGAWTSGDNLIAIHVDNTAPVITAEINKYGDGSSAISGVPSDAPASSKLYESDMYLKGCWTLVATLLDETSVTGYSVLKDAGVIEKGTGYFVKEDVHNSDNSKHGVRLYIPIPKDSNTVKLTVNANDAEHSASQEFSFNIDEIAPTLDSLSGNGTLFRKADGSTEFTSIENSDYRFTIAGSSTDEGSGVENIVFYYMRKNGPTGTISKDVVMDSMTDTGTDDSKVEMSNLETLEFTQGAEKFYLYAKKYTGSATTEKFTVSGTYDSHVRVGGLVQIDGVLRRITAISTTEVTFTPSLAAEKSSVDAYFPIAQVIDNSATEKVSSYSGRNFTFEKGDDGDGMPESFSKTGKTWTWDATIHSDNMPDGPVSLVILAFDKAGNIAGQTINTKITNNAPRIAKLYLATDLNDNNKFETNEFEEYSIIGKEGLAQATYTIDFANFGTEYGAGVFTAKNKLAVVPEIVGGNKSIKLVAKKDATAATAEPGSGANLIASIASKKATGTSATGWTKAQGTQAYEITADKFMASAKNNSFYAYVLENSVLTGIAEFDTNATSAAGRAKNEEADGTDKNFSFTFWDETEEATPGTDSQKAVVLVKGFSFDLTDGTSPTVVVNPFYWQNINSNSIYGSSGAEKVGDLKGHIELENDIKNITAITSALGVDPKISGKVTFTGTAYDEHSLGTLKFTFSNGTEKPFENIPMATYDKDASVWKIYGDNNNKSIDTDGYEVTVSSIESDSNGVFGDKVYFGQKGHKIFWTLSINTEKLTSIAAENMKLTVLATDLASNETKLSETVNETTVSKIVAPVVTEDYIPASQTGTRTVTDGTTNYPEYQVDVVPYVTGVETKLSSLKNNNPSVYNRSAQGHYPVSSSETIKVTGFNLAGGTVKFASDSTSETDYTVAYNSAGFSIPEKAKSGVVSISVNGVESLNNKNYKDSRGAYTGTVDLTAYPTGDKSVYTKYYYNRQPNGDNNNLLTDDVVLDIWEFKDVAQSQQSGYITEPIMKINPKNEMIDFAFNNGPAHFSMSSGVRTGWTSAATATPVSFQSWVGNYARFTSCGFTIDENGNTHGITVGLDTNPKDKHAGRMQYFTGIKGRANLNSEGNYDGGKNTTRIESIGAPKGTYDGNVYSDIVILEDRFSSPTLTTTVHDDKVYVYLAYYDDLNGQIRFRYGADVKKTDSHQTFGQFVDHDGKGLFDAGTSEYSIIADNTMGEKSGPYVSIDAIKGATSTDDVVVATWYDASSVKWYYSYKKNPCNDNDMGAGSTDGYWHSPILLASNAGENCQIAVDAKGGIHIASYETANADLLYAYLSSYDDSTPQVVTVDSYAFTGTNIRLDVAISDDGNYVVPYIGYYMSSSQKPKMAYLKNIISASSIAATREAVIIPAGVDSLEVNTSKWEASLIPTTSRYADNYNYSYVNVGVWKDENGKIKAPAAGNSSDKTSSYENIAVADTIAGCDVGYVYGNGTANPVLGYATRVGTRGHIETAQMK